MASDPAESHRLEPPRQVPCLAGACCSPVRADHLPSRGAPPSSRVRAAVPLLHPLDPATACFTRSSSAIAEVPRRGNRLPDPWTAGIGRARWAHALHHASAYLCITMNLLLPLFFSNEHLASR